MIAWINGIQVQGSPEEIERYRQMTAEKKAHTFFNFPETKDDVPEHVKKYKSHPGWKASGETHIRVWF